jgi:SWI/SNF-related matrix-associated actin-dependent regulator 1 of chromatin subfamily A
MSIKAQFKDGVYWLTEVPDRYLFTLREKGWVYDEDLNRWGTSQPDIAEEMFPRGSRTVARGLEKANNMAMASYNLSFPDRMTASEIVIRKATPVREELRHYQEAGIANLIRPGNQLLADDMGLGKTIQAIVAANILEPETVLIICPASVKANWVAEWLKWAMLPYRTIGFAMGDDLPNTSVLVINYDILDRHLKALQASHWGLIILDEAQYLQNPDTIRTRTALGTVKTPTLKTDKIIALTGTPMTNAPIDMYPILKRLDYWGWGNRMSFGRQFCDGHWEQRRVRKGEMMKVWVDTGSTNPEKLQNRLRSTIMTRRLKKDALPELPPKIRQIVYLEPDMNASRVLKMEENIFGRQTDLLNDEQYQGLAKTLSGVRPAFDEISAVRRETGLAKIPLALDHIQETIDAVDKVIVFAHHIEVISVLARYFPESVTLDGRTTDRQEVVDVFNSDPAIKLFIGNIKAAGVGINLTASSTVLFLEHPWTPAAANQAEDRPHRIGQKNVVLVQHLVLKKSLDATMVRTIIRKQEVIDKIVN